MLVLQTNGSNEVFTVIQAIKNSIDIPSIIAYISPIL